jgi:hypothetical protein
MKRFFLSALALALMLGLNGATWASRVVSRCPGKCPFCP